MRADHRADLRQQRELDEHEVSAAAGPVANGTQFVSLLKPRSDLFDGSGFEIGGQRSLPGGIVPRWKGLKQCQNDYPLPIRPDELGPEIYCARESSDHAKLGACLTATSTKALMVTLTVASWARVNRSTMISTFRESHPPTCRTRPLSCRLLELQGHFFLHCLGNAVHTVQYLFSRGGIGNFKAKGFVQRDD